MKGVEKVLLGCVAVFSAPAVVAQDAKVQTAPSTQHPVSPLQGRWDLTIRGPESSFPGWLEVRTEGSGLIGRLQWGWGHAIWILTLLLISKSILNESDFPVK